MISSRLSRYVNTGLGRFGLELHRKHPADELSKFKLDAVQRLERQSLRGALQHARTLGVHPNCVFDIGAAYGTPELYATFPDARHVLVEPLDEYRPFLERVVNTYPHTEYIIAAATDQTGTLTIHVHQDLVGSSAYAEVEESDGLNDTQRTVAAITLDRLVADRQLTGPYVMKVDVQGAELDVLSGAAQVLEATEYVLLEVSLFAFYREGVQFAEVIEFMEQRGFAAYDIVGHSYRPLDGALAQVDVGFVKKDGHLRSQHGFATPAQRAALTQLLLASESAASA
jgi:FkbM family methyltransferase